MAKKLEEGDEERGRYLETLKNGSRFRVYVGFDRQRAEKPIAEYLGLDKDGFLYLMIDHLESDEQRGYARSAGPVLDR